MYSRKLISFLIKPIETVLVAKFGTDFYCRVENLIALASVVIEVILENAFKKTHLFHFKYFIYPMRVLINVVEEK